MKGLSLLVPASGSPGAEFRAGSRRVIRDDRVGRPLALSAGSLRAAAAAGDPAASSLRGVLPGATGRETPGAGAGAIPSATGKTAPSNAAAYCRSFTAAAGSGAVGRAGDFSR